MPTSRSPAEFLRRHGVISTPRLGPRLDIGALKVNALPLKRGQLDPSLMIEDGLGNPPPDRGPTDEWPPPQKV